MKTARDKNTATVIFKLPQYLKDKLEARATKMKVESIAELTRHIIKEYLSK